MSGSEYASVSRSGIEDVGVEEPQRRARQLVRDPGHGPLVELGVGVVVARQRPRSGDERPGVEDGEQQAQRRDRPRTKRSFAKRSSIQLDREFAARIAKRSPELMSIGGA